VLVSILYCMLEYLQTVVWRAITALLPASTSRAHTMQPMWGRDIQPPRNAPQPQGRLHNHRPKGRVKTLSPVVSRVNRRGESCWTSPSLSRADGGYWGPEFRASVKAVLSQVDVEIVKRSEEAKGFVVLPKRWVVQRPLAWLNRCRRLSKDWENLNRKAQAFLVMASIRFMVRRLCRA
jgi:transposase